VHRPAPRVVLPVLTALALALPAVPASAAPGGGDGPARTTSYALGPAQARIFPEGITTEGRYYYVSSTTDGAVLRGDLRRPEEPATVFLPGGQAGRTTARGLDATADLLLVAGGTTGTLYVHDRETGALLSTHALAGAFLNDVRVAPDGTAYVTDSTRDLVYRVPAEALGTTSGALEVFAAGSTGDPIGTFNANGLAVSSDGRFLVVVQTDTGRLFRISTRDRSVVEIDLGGATVRNGDGIVLQGRTLYVVRNADAVVSEVRLSGDLRRGRLVGTTGGPSIFAFPTTAALSGGRLLVVNSQFDRRAAPGPFTVTSLPRP
jgi:sugar lactone lactonase YvrE